MFKVGDRVRCVDSKFAAGELEEGTEYEVVRQDDAGVFLKGSLTSWRPDRFELVAPAADWRSVWQEKTRGGHEVLFTVQDSDGRWVSVMRRSDNGEAAWGIHAATGRWLGFATHEYDMLPLVPVAPPAPARRPPTREEVAALGFVWVRSKNALPNCWCALVAVNSSMVRLTLNEGHLEVSLSSLAEHWEYTRDGKAWREFWVEVAT